MPEKRYSDDYPPPDFIDPVVEAYKKDVDQTLLTANLRLSIPERLQRMEAAILEMDRLRGSGRRARSRNGDSV